VGMFCPYFVAENVCDGKCLVGVVVGGVIVV